MTKVPAQARKQHRKTHIREWRKHRGKTLEWLAEKVELEPSALSYLERGLSGYTQPTIEKIAAALETTPDILIRRAPSASHHDMLDTATDRELRELASMLSALRETRKSDE